MVLVRILPAEEAPGSRRATVMASVRRGPAALVLRAESDSSFWSSRNGTKRRPASGPGEDSRSRRAEWNGTQRIRSGPRGAVEPLRQHRGRTVPDITKEKIMNVLDLQSLSTGVRPTGRRFSTWSSGCNVNWSSWSAGCRR